ncbi:MAG: aconitase X catalytic domain-containing protein [Desulfurococcales archaeon]|nr:aconitase X catalytic domain-containing protein [Desulfurococcales archaeon]
MELTREEEEILKGRRGEAAARALEAIVKVGEALGAERLVPIRHAHVSGVSYGNIGEAGARFLEELAEQGARFAVPTTVNPLGYDPWDPGFYGATREYVEGQERIIRALTRMGALPSFTCTPYKTSLFEAEAPPPGSHVAWGESSAVVYANSFLGLRTNREGGPLALLAAIAGRTYYYGLHTPEGRIPRVEYRVEAPGPLGDAEAGVLGAIIGEAHEDPEPPALRASFEGDLALRELSAALGAAGSVGMVYVHGLTPEPLPRGWRPEERVTIEAGEVRARLEEHAPASPGEVDLYFVGCPHLDYEDLARLASYMRRYGPSRKPFIAATSNEAYIRALGDGTASTLRSLGVRIARGTCLIVSPMNLRGVTVATNSYKALFYLSRRGARVRLAGLEQLARLAAGAGET